MPSQNKTCLKIKVYEKKKTTIGTYWTKILSLRMGQSDPTTQTGKAVTKMLIGPVTSGQQNI